MKPALRAVVVLPPSMAPAYTSASASTYVSPFAVRA